MDLKVIGIAGVARVGKDTFADCLIDLFAEAGQKAQRVAFADALKEDLKDFLLAKTGVNPYTKDTSSKNLLRPLMVEYGRLMRSLTQGQYWIAEITEKIENNTKNNIISILSDVRYGNEAEWINQFRSGITIHLHRTGIEAANKEEASHDPYAQKASHYSINWRNCENATQLHNQVEKYFHAFEIASKFIRPTTHPQSKTGPQSGHVSAGTSRKT